MVANPIQILEEAQKQFQEGDKLNVQLLDEVGFCKFP